MGGGLLLLRAGVFESNVFKELKNQKNVKMGNFLSLFTNSNRLGRYLRCIGIGLPTWFVIEILATFSNEFSDAPGIAPAIQPSLFIMWCYVGLSTGDIASGFISQLHRQRQSRRKMWAIPDVPL